MKKILTILYKAERSRENAYEENFSIKVGTEKPNIIMEVPRWQYNQGKGSLHVTVRNVNCNTKYTVKLRLFNTAGVRELAGLVSCGRGNVK